MTLRQILLCVALCCAAAFHAIPVRAQSVPGVNPVTGETTLSVTDWSDAGAHPISLTRYYRSWGSLQTGLGAG